MATVTRLAFIAAIVVASLALPHKSRAESRDLTACRDKIDEGAFRNSQLAACFDQELSRQDKRLNAEYKALQASLAKNSPQGVKLLTAAQRAWLAYRNSWCNFEANSDPSAAPGPALNQTICMAEFTERQADLIHGEIP